MPVKKYSKFPKTLALLLFPLCKDAVDVFYSTRQLGWYIYIYIIYIYIYIYIYNIYIYIYIYMVGINEFPDFFVQAFKIVVDSWKFSILLLYMLWDDWPIFIISGSNEQLQQQLKYTLLKPHFHSWWISKMQSERKDTLEEQYVIKFCFKLGKMPQKRMECFRLLLDQLALIEHQFLSGVRDSRKPGSLWEMLTGVGGVKESIHHSWLAKGLGLGLLCWGFKGVQEEIPSTDASTLQIGSVAFPPRQCTSPQLHPDYLSKMGIKTVPHPPYCPDPCSLWLLVIP